MSSDMPKDVSSKKSKKRSPGSSSKSLITDNYINVKVNSRWVDGKHYVNPARDSGSTVIFPDYYTFLQDAEIYKDVSKSDFPNLYRSLSPYGRISSSSVLVTEQALAKLDGADFAKMTSCGLSAIRTVLMAYGKKDGHMIISDGIYGPAKRFIVEVLAAYGMQVSYFDPLKPEQINSLIRPQTTMIYFESPCSSLFEVIDTDKIVSIAKKTGITTCMDNTYSTPFYYRPLDHGIDIAVYSLTKFVSGHSDLMGGVISANQCHFEKIYNWCDLLGNHVTAEVAYMMLRGIRTMPIRMEKSSQSADKIIAFLKNHPLIAKIYYPKMKNSLGREYFYKAYSGAPGLMTLAFKSHYSPKKLDNFFKKLSLFKMGYSYGGFESLMVTLNLEGSRNYSANKPLHNHIHIRMYIGLENAEDLIDDLKNGFDYLAKINEEEKSSDSINKWHKAVNKKLFKRTSPIKLSKKDFRERAI